MSYLEKIAQAGKKQVTEKVKQTVKQKKVIVKQEKPTIKQERKQEHLKLNPTVKTIKDIPNTNIMTSGKLLGIHLRDKKEPMLKQLKKYITKLLGEEKNDA